MRTLAASIALALLLSTPAFAQPSCTSSGTITCGQTVSNRMENAQCSFANASQPYMYYVMNLTAGQVIDVFLEADDFPPAVGIYNFTQSAPLAYDRGLTIAHVSFDVRATGQYRILATVDGSTRTNGVFDLSVFCKTVCLAPYFTRHPGFDAVPSGASATLSTVADGTPPLSYRWFDITNPSVTLGNNASVFVTPPLTQTTSYAVEVSNACGVTRSLSGTVTVGPCTPPAVIALRTPPPVRFGGSGIVEAQITGSAPLSYQWYEGTPPDTSRPLGDPTVLPSLVLTQLIAPRTIWLRVTNGCGTADSAAATVKLESVLRRRPSAR